MIARAPGKLFIFGEYTVRGWHGPNLSGTLSGKTESLASPNSLVKTTRRTTLRLICRKLLGNFHWCQLSLRRLGFICSKTRLLF